jgi:hypothetical protein
VELETYSPIIIPPIKVNGGIKAFHYARRSFILLVICVLLAMIYWVYPFDPVDYHWIKMNDTVVKRGSSVSYNISMTKNVNISPVITREFVAVDNPSEAYTATDFTMGSACAGKNVKHITMGVPYWLPAKRYFIRARVVFPYPGGRLVDDSYITPSFEVIK